MRKPGKKQRKEILLGSQEARKKQRKEILLGSQEARKKTEVK